MKPGIVITTDPSRGIALVRGETARFAIKAVITDRKPAWSPGGRGYVIPLRYVPDLEAYAQAHREIVVVHQRKAAG